MGLDPMELLNPRLRVTTFSDCRRYRYTLWREWDDGLFSMGGENYLMVIGLNPSTADETKNDPTIRRCIAFAKQWGFAALCMTNLFAWRDTDPSKMRHASEPIGPQNDECLLRCASGAGMILAAWGAYGDHMGRGEQVRAFIQPLHALHINADGSPKHPLYVASNTKPFIWVTT